jgi:hypothetical protein
VVDYGKERQERFLASLGLNDVSWSRLLGLLAGGVLLIMLGYAVFSLRLKKTSDPALVLYRRFCRKLARAGLVRAPHEGAFDFARRCIHRRPELKDRIEIITQGYTRARYGRSVNAQEWREFKRAVTAFRL